MLPPPKTSPQNARCCYVLHASYSPVLYTARRLGSSAARMPLLLYCCQSVSQSVIRKALGSRSARAGTRAPCAWGTGCRAAHTKSKGPRTAHASTRTHELIQRGCELRSEGSGKGNRDDESGLVSYTSTHLWWRHVVAVVVAWSHGGWWLVIPQQERGRHHRHGRHSHAEPCGCGRELQMPDRKEETRGCRQTDARVGSRQNAHQARRQAGGLVDASSTVWFAAVATQTSSSSPSQPTM